MRANFTNLVRLQEAVAPQETDETEEKKKKEAADKEAANKAAYAERVNAAFNEYGGYAPPAAIEIKPEDQERWAKLAKARGTDIDEIRAQEIGDAVRRQREAKEAAKNQVSEKEAAERLRKSQEIGAKIGIDPNDVSVHQRVSDATRMVRSLIGKDPIKDTITDEEWKTADIEAKHQKAQDRRRDVEKLQRQVRTLVGRYGNIGGTTDEKGNVVGGGLVTLPSGETVDINKLKQAVDAFDSSVFARKQTRQIKNEKGEIQNVDIKDKEELADPTSKEYQDNLRHLTELGRATRLASEYYSELERPTKAAKGRDETVMSVDQSAAGAAGVAAPSSAGQKASNTPSPSPASPVSSGRLPQPSKAKTTAPQTQSEPPGTLKPLPTGAVPGEGIIQGAATPSEAGFSPLNTAIKNANNNRLAAVVGPVLDNIARQQQLTRSIATPQQTPSQTEQRPVEIASAQSSGSTKDARYKARKATSQGIQVVAEHRLQFNKNELKAVLNEAWGARQWRNWAKYVATPALKKGGKLLGSVALQHLGRTSINPVDRYPTNIYQAGYSKAKSMRQARYLYQNPTKLMSALTAVPQLSALSGIAGAGALGLLGKLGIDSEEGKQSLASVIPTYMSIVNDPRDATLDVGSIIRSNDDDDEETVLKKLLGTKGTSGGSTPTGTP